NGCGCRRAARDGPGSAPRFALDGRLVGRRLLALLPVGEQQGAEAEQEFVGERHEIRDEQVDDEQHRRRQEQARIAQLAQPAQQGGDQRIGPGVTAPAIGRDTADASTWMVSANMNGNPCGMRRLLFRSAWRCCNPSARAIMARTTRETPMKNNTLAVALAALLIGGVATAGYINSRDKNEPVAVADAGRSEEHTSEIQSREKRACRCLPGK